MLSLPRPGLSVESRILRFPGSIICNYRGFGFSLALMSLAFYILSGKKYSYVIVHQYSRKIDEIPQDPMDEYLLLSGI